MVGGEFLVRLATTQTARQTRAPERREDRTLNSAEAAAAESSGSTARRWQARSRTADTDDMTGNALELAKDLRLKIVDEP